MAAIKLGHKPEGLKIEELTAPQGPDDPYYPSFYIDSDDEDLLKLPDEGKAVIEFKVTSRRYEEQERKGKTKKSCNICIEVMSIEPEKKAAKPKGNKDARDAVEKYFDKDDSD